jgi:hypothetical protein
LHRIAPSFKKSCVAAQAAKYIDAVFWPRDPFSTQLPLFINLLKTLDLTGLVHDNTCVESPIPGRC